MLAAGLSFALFVYWSVLGYAALSLLHATRSRLQDLLISAPVGLVLTLIPVFTLNRLGLPVRQVGIPIAAVLLAAAVGVLWKTRPGWPWRRVWPFAVIALLGWWLTGRATLSFGFDWLSFCNDDMANYTLAADRFYRQGFFDFPTDDAILHGQYYPSNYWFMHVAAVVRPGSDLVLAWVMSVTGLNAHKVFMPTIMAFHMALMLTASGMVLSPGGREERRRRSRTGRNRNEIETDLPSVSARGAESASTERSGAAEIGALGSPASREEGDEAYGQALVACALLAMSALMTLGTLYQLIAQVSGLTLMVLAGVLVLRPFHGVSRWGVVRHSILTGIIGAGLLIQYPEVTPFLGLAFLAYTGLGLVRRRLRVTPVVVLVAVSLLVVVVLLRTYMMGSIEFLRYQSQLANSDSTDKGVDVQNTLFPYYLLPNGLGDLWGFLRIGGAHTEPLLSISIAAGAVVLLLAMAATARMAWRGRPEATFAAVMLVLGIHLFRSRAGFGLFKLAMFIQPVVLPTLAVAWFTLMRRRRLRLDVSLAVALVGIGVAVFAGILQLGADLAPGVVAAATDTLRVRIYIALLVCLVLVGLMTLMLRGTPRLPRLAGAILPLLVLAVAGMRSQRSYVASSFGEGSSFLEISNPSESHINKEFAALVRPADVKVVISDTFNLVLAKFQSMYTPGKELSFPSNDFFTNLEAASITDWRNVTPSQAAKSRELVKERAAQMPEMTFDPKDPDLPKLKNPFRLCDIGTLDGVLRPGTVLVQTVGRQNILNRRYFPPETSHNYNATSIDQVHDYLIFVSSRLGAAYFIRGIPGVNPSVYQIEDEPHFYSGSTMAAVGRYMMAQVVNPSPKFRVVVTLTCSYQTDGQNLLPPKMAVVGKDRQLFPVVGRGSARLISPPVEPQMLNGRDYVMIDYGTTGQRFPSPRSGLMKLYGTDVAIDRRVLVGFVRDISLVSEETYQAFKPPAVLERFDDSRENPLRNTDLAYSGFYEDGWVSENAVCHLTQPAGADRLIVRGQVPNVDTGMHQEFVLTLDGTEVGRISVVPAVNGEFELHAPVPPSTGIHEVGLRFSQVQRLNAPDNRPVGARLTWLGFQAAPVAAARAGVR